MRSPLATNMLLMLVVATQIGSTAFRTLYADPVNLAIVHESQLETAREYRAAVEIHEQNWQYMLDRFFVVRCNSDQATQGDAE